jgi:hypothetical protein
LLNLATPRSVTGAGQEPTFPRMQEIGPRTPLFVYWLVTRGQGQRTIGRGRAREPHVPSQRRPEQLRGIAIEASGEPTAPGTRGIHDHARVIAMIEPRFRVNGEDPGHAAARGAEFLRLHIVQCPTTERAGPTQRFHEQALRIRHVCVIPEGRPLQARAIDIREVRPDLGGRD